MKRSNVWRWVGIGALTLGFFFNMQYALIDYGMFDGTLGYQLVAQANTEGGTGGGGTDDGGGSTDGGSDDCPWYVLSAYCNKRVESIPVTCTISYGVTRTYKDSKGKIVGSGVVNGATITMSWGVQTTTYTEHGGNTESYGATKVNCPTDGNKYYCETYFPC